MDEWMKAEPVQRVAPPVVKVEGEPSNYMRRLQEAKAKAQAGEAPAGVEFSGVNDGDTYQLVTEAVAEAKVWPVVGGYVDRDGTLHNVVQFRAISGVEEDLLNDDETPWPLLINAVLANCVVAIGSIVDPGEIRRAIYQEIPSATRLDMLLGLRCASHWKTAKSLYEMTTECAVRSCQKRNDLELDLIKDIERYDPPEPTRDEYVCEISDAGVEVVWRRIKPDMDAAISVIGQRGSAEERKALLTYAMMARLQSVGGERVVLTANDLISSNYRKVSLSKVARYWFAKVQRWTSSDRGWLRRQFIRHEPGIELEFDFECEGCGRRAKRTVDLMQRGFFFPQEARQLSKRTSST